MPFNQPFVNRAILNLNVLSRNLFYQSDISPFLKLDLLSIKDNFFLGWLISDSSFLTLLFLSPICWFPVHETPTILEV